MESIVDQITDQGLLLAYIVRAQFTPDSTTFVTSPDLNQQVGFIVYKSGETIPAHEHLPVERKISGTSEVILVRQGSCVVDIFNENRELVSTRELSEGDLIGFVAGGHGFRMKEDTVLLEIKQGPYSGLQEKTHF